MPLLIADMLFAADFFVIGSAKISVVCGRHAFTKKTLLFFQDS
jgi:hypothetical protein